jgi:hypothetical protein
MKAKEAAVGRKDAIQHQRMDVHVQVQRAAEPLNDGHGTAAAAHHTGVPGPTTQKAEHHPERDADNRPTEMVVPRQLIAQPIGQTQDPLSDRYIGQHVIDQVRGTLRHAASATRCTEAASLARERHQPIVAAAVAVKPREPCGQAPAGEKFSELLLDETRQAFPVAPQGGFRTERLEVIADDAVEHGLQRIAGVIGVGGQRTARTRRACQMCSSRIGPE